MLAFDPEVSKPSTNTIFCHSFVLPSLGVIKGRLSIVLAVLSEKNVNFGADQSTMIKLS